jgi:hypothetical protein
MCKVIKKIVAMITYERGKMCTGGGEKWKIVVLG